MDGSRRKIIMLAEDASAFSESAAGRADPQAINTAHALRVIRPGSRGLPGIPGECW